MSRTVRFCAKRHTLIQDFVLKGASLIRDDVAETYIQNYFNYSKVNGVDNEIFK